MAASAPHVGAPPPPAPARPCSAHPSAHPSAPLRRPRRIGRASVLLLLGTLGSLRPAQARAPRNGGYANAGHRANLLRDIHRLSMDVHARSDAQRLKNDTAKHQAQLVEENRAYQPVVLATAVADDSLAEALPVFFRTFLEAHDDAYALHIACIDPKSLDECNRLVDQRLEDKERGRLKCYDYLAYRASLYRRAYAAHQRKTASWYETQIQKCRNEYVGRRHAQTAKEKSCARAVMAAKRGANHGIRFEETGIGTSNHLQRQDDQIIVGHNRRYVRGCERCREKRTSLGTEHNDIQWLAVYHAIDVWDNFNDAALLMVHVDTMWFKPFHHGAFSRYAPRAANEEELSWKDRGRRAIERTRVFNELASFMWTESGLYYGEESCKPLPGLMYFPAGRHDLLRFWSFFSEPNEFGEAPDFVATLQEWQHNVTNTSLPVPEGWSREEQHFRCLNPRFFPNGDTCDDNACGIEWDPKAWVTWHPGTARHHAQAGGLLAGQQVLSAVDHHMAYEFMHRFCKNCNGAEILDLDNGGPEKILPPSFDENPFNGTAECDHIKCIKRKRHELEAAERVRLGQLADAKDMFAEGR